MGIHPSKRSENPLAMQFAPLRYFLESACLGSIRKAAERLHVAPSAVSRQIAMLEADYGLPLFERLATGMRLTEAGEVFARQARATLRDFERLQSEIDDFQQLRRGTVRIVTVWAPAASIIFEAIAEFSLEYPGIEFDVEVIGGAEIIAAVTNEECDIAIGFEPSPHLAVEEMASLRDPIVAVMHPDHPLASHRALTLRQIANHPVALPDLSTITRALLDQALASRGISMHTKVTFSGVGFVSACVRANRLVGFAPSLVVRSDVEAGLVAMARIVDRALPATRFVLCKHKSRLMPLPAQAFMSALQRRFADLDNVAKSMADTT